MSSGAMDSVADLRGYLDRSPTPYHAVAETVRRLQTSDHREVSETEVWDFSAGDRCYVVRSQGSIVAFQVGAVSPAAGGFRIVGAHTDSPNLRVKRLADVVSHGYRQLAVEPYGAALLHTWLDRDLSLAGRVTLDGGKRPRSVLLDFSRPLLRIPNLAVHLRRGPRNEGLKLNPQKHLVPVVGLEGAPEFAELVASELRAQRIAEVEADQVLSFDLMTYDVQPSSVSGIRGEFLHASRLDNLASCHAAVSALTTAADSPRPPFTRVVVLYDHEEIGSRSAYGASGPLLADVLDRILSGFGGSERQGVARALARSIFISVDMAHAVHPNYADRHDPGHHPVIGKGPVIKQNASQSYAGDADTTGFFRAICSRVGIEPQHFVSRNDVACGTTIGPITAARVGIRTVDVGNPTLSMHSCREMAGTEDVQPMIDVLRRFFEEE